MALVFMPKVIELVRRKGAGLGANNGTLNEPAMTKEEEKMMERLINENEELAVSSLINEFFTD